MDAVEKYGFGSSPFQADGGVTFGRSESGFDTLAIRYYGSTTSPQTYADLHWPTGSTVSGWANMFISEVNCQQEGASVWAFTVQAKGLLSTQAVKRTITTKTTSYTTGPIDLPGAGPVVAQSQGTYTNLSCTFQYVSLFLPVLNVEPQNASLPPGTSLPSPPSNPWTSAGAITTPIYNYPYGWIRRGIDIDNVNGAEVYFIKEEWDYVYEYQPG